MIRRQRLLLAVLTVAGLTALIWAVMTWSDARAAAQLAAGDLETCQALEREIALLRDQPRQARAVTLEQPEMARRIEQAAQKAGVDKRNIERITPAEPHRIKETVFLEAPTQITLSRVTLAQVVTFLHALSQGSASEKDLMVQSVRMGAPRGSEAGDTWGAEILVSYLVYSPPTDSTVRTVP